MSVESYVPFGTYERVIRNIRKIPDDGWTWVFDNEVQAKRVYDGMRNAVKVYTKGDMQARKKGNSVTLVKLNA